MSISHSTVIYCNISDGEFSGGDREQKVSGLLDYYKLFLKIYEVYYIFYLCVDRLFFSLAGRNI